MRGGHWAASCTFLAEVAHKEFATKVAECGRTYGSLNKSQQAMFKWTLLRELYGDVQALIPDDGDDGDLNHAVNDGDDGDHDWEHQCSHPLQCDRLWRTPPDNGNDYRHWENKLLCQQVRVSRGELLTILCSKLGLVNNRQCRHRLANLLHFQFYGQLKTKIDTGGGKTFARTFVAHGLALSKENRRDFVRVSGVENNTCLTAEIIMFVRVSGFQSVNNNGGVVLPEIYRTDNPGGSILFTLVRWLIPHADALLRDSQLRPIGRPPLDINHALWKFAERDRPVPEVAFRRQLHFYGSADERVENLRLERRAYFDLLQPDCFETYVNCTVHENNTILETVTLPF